MQGWLELSDFMNSAFWLLINCVCRVGLVGIHGLPFLAMLFWNFVEACLSHLIVHLRHMTQIFSDRLNPSQESSTTIDTRCVRSDKLTLFGFTPLLMLTLNGVVEAHWLLHLRFHINFLLALHSFVETNRLLDRQDMYIVMRLLPPPRVRYIRCDVVLYVAMSGGLRRKNCWSGALACDLSLMRLQSCHCDFSLR